MKKYLILFIFTITNICFFLLTFFESNVSKTELFSFVQENEQPRKCIASTSLMMFFSPAVSKVRYFSFLLNKVIYSVTIRVKIINGIYLSFILFSFCCRSSFFYSNIISLSFVCTILGVKHIIFATNNVVSVCFKKQ